MYDPGRWPRARSKVSAITDDDDDDEEEIEDDPSRWSRYLIHVFRWYGPTRSSSDSHSRSDVVAAVDSDAMMVGGRWVVWARDRGDRVSQPAEKKCENSVSGGGGIYNGENYNIEASLIRDNGLVV